MVRAVREDQLIVVAGGHACAWLYDSDGLAKATFLSVAQAGQLGCRQQKR